MMHVLSSASPSSQESFFDSSSSSEMLPLFAPSSCALESVQFVAPPRHHASSRAISFTWEDLDCIMQEEDGDKNSPRWYEQEGGSSQSCQPPVRRESFFYPEEKVRRCSHSRKVSFAPALQVRTHEIVLGNHPACSDGLSVELGWGYAQEEILDLEIHQSQRTKKLASSSSCCLHRRSYWERKALLQHVAGVTEAQVTAATLQAQQV